MTEERDYNIGWYAYQTVAIPMWQIEEWICSGQDVSNLELYVEESENV